MELENQPKLKSMTIKVPESTYNKLLLLKKVDGLPPALRVRNMIRALADTDSINTYQG
jgi:hypothetical protein